MSKNGMKLIGICVFGYIMYKLSNKSKQKLRKYRIKNATFKPKIVIIGAGYSGICAAIKLITKLGYSNFIILEREQDIGGTWHANTYPNLECDIPSYLYSFSFEQKYNWSKEYAPGPEIFKYLKMVCDKYGLYKYIKFGCQVERLEYDDERCEYTIQYSKVNDDIKYFTKGNIVINGTGGLSNPKWINIDGLNTFKGFVMHSAKWDWNIDLTNKNIALIGTGTSALQATPYVQKKAKKLIIFQRSPTYVFEKMDKKIKNIHHFIYYYFPPFMWLKRFGIWLYQELLMYPLLIKKNKGYQKIVMKLWTEWRDKQIKDPILRQKVTPNFPMGLKRMGISNTYYKCLQQNNVELIASNYNNDGIDCILSDGKTIKTKHGKEYKIDGIIMCTGFRVQDIDAFGGGMYGINGQSLRDTWIKNGVEGYKGIMVHNFPNWFILLGPNSGSGNNSVVITIEQAMEYTLKCIEQMILNNWKQLNIKKSIQDKWNIKLQNRLQEMVWTHPAKSWYKDDKGRVTALYGWNSIQYWWETKNPNFNEFHIIKG